ncbi:NUDIX hydrolase [Desulfoferula mesophila]|uniref:GDP-mannose pyrophosphatase n=1 Tax=Desulfoferula mesophila TaxID=3058419 RepID=A0AAU9E9P7_9BACT|nr:ADP-ribose pyrophosphatase [Desulfoferula mesophilus]
MTKAWPLLSSQPVAEVGLFSVTRDRALSPRTDQERDFYVVHMPDWLQIVALTSQGRLIMVRQYRHASRRIGLEVPGGLLDATDPDPVAAALRELKEETGYAGGETRDLGSYWPQPALLANRVHFVAATGMVPTGAQEQDAGEDIEVVLVAPDELERLLADGEIHNAMSVMALGLASQAGVLSGRV